MSWKKELPLTREEKLDLRNLRMGAMVGTVMRNPRSVATIDTSPYKPQPKEAPLESAAYENAVRNLGRCVRCGRACRPQFCHRDEGKGVAIKTDVREGWAGCPDCHALLGGHDGRPRMPREERRIEELRLAKLTRQILRACRTWPKSVPEWPEEAA